MTLLTILSLLPILAFCILSSEKGDFGIDVILTNEFLVIEGNEMKLARIHEQLDRVKEEKERSGIPQDQLVIRIRVSPETEQGKLGELEAILRRLNFSKVEYYDYRP